MSTGLPIDSWSETFTSAVRDTRGAFEWPRRLALVAGLTLIGSFLSSLYYITDVVGGLGWLVLVVAGAFVLGTIAARLLRLQIGLGMGLILFLVGLGGYLVSIPEAYRAMISLELLSDLAILVLGDISLLQIVRADLWAIAIAPAPVFGTWYLLVRRQYGLSAWVGGLTLGFFVLTGDASEAVTVIGVTGALGILGFGSLDGTAASWTQIREVGLVLAVAIVASRLARPVSARLAGDRVDSPGLGPTGSSPPTLEGSLIDAPARVDILGGISLSPEVRFTVTANRPALWHVAAYDRFTGRGWVRSGDATSYSTPLPPPPGETQTLEQTFEAEATVNTMPAAWKPVRVGTNIATQTRVTALGGLQPARSFRKGESYSVISERLDWTSAQLRGANADFPESLRDRYLQLPNSTPRRVQRFAEELTANADTWFAKAAVIEQWLERNKAYSLDVTRPDGDIADAFIFEMERGYCVYYATTMVALLRALDIPARFAVGYATGEPVADERWVVRGFNSHAWVEVFFPKFGWVAFDPTPSRPREAARRQRLDEARAANESGIDTNLTRSTPAAGTSEEPGGDQLTVEDIESNQTGFDPDSDAAASGVDGVTPPGRGAFQQAGRDSTGVSRRALFTNLSDIDKVAIGAGIIGVLLGINRFQLLRRVYRFVEVGWQSPTESPLRDVQRAFDRLEWVLARGFRARRIGETRQDYVRRLQSNGWEDNRVQRLLTIYELAVYKGDVSRSRADEAIRLVNDFVRERYLSLHP